MKDTYTDRNKRKWCDVCHGTGWVVVTDLSGYDVAKPCACEEGQQRREAILNPKKEVD